LLTQFPNARSGVSVGRAAPVGMRTNGLLRNGITFSPFVLPSAPSAPTKPLKRFCPPGLVRPRRLPFSTACLKAATPGNTRA
jgi:hypothetical protein